MFASHVTVTPNGKMTRPICPRLPRSLLPVAALPLLYSPVSRSESPPQSLQPLPSSQHQGFPAVSVTVASLHPAWVHAARTELDQGFHAGSVVLSQHYQNHCDTWSMSLCPRAGAKLIDDHQLGKKGAELSPHFSWRWHQQMSVGLLITASEPLLWSWCVYTPVTVTNMSGFKSLAFRYLTLNHFSKKCRNSVHCTREPAGAFTVCLA